MEGRDKLIIGWNFRRNEIIVRYSMRCGFLKEGRIFFIGEIREGFVGEVVFDIGFEG